MERNNFYSIIHDQQKIFDEPMTGIVDRSIVSEAIRISTVGMPIIVTGVRRCGKSTFLRLLKEQLSSDDKGFLYLNFNDDRLIKFQTEDFQKVLDYMDENSYKQKCILFLDEIQETSGWEKWIDRIKDRYMIFMTGSNSKLLSSEISTILTGRTLSMRLYPFGFKEFLDARKFDVRDIGVDMKKQSLVRVHLKEFLEYGGFPKRVLTRQNILLSELFQDIIYRDVLSRFSGKQSVSIKEAVQFLISSISKPVSTRNLSNAAGIKNLQVTKKILDVLESAYILFSVRKFDYSVRKQLQNPRKMYCIDNGLIAANSFRTSSNCGVLLENAVFIELKRRNKEVYYHSGSNECDFIVKEGKNVVAAIQSCYALNEENKGRELKGLSDAMSAFKLREGLIITFDQEDRLRVDGKVVKVVPAWKWLLQV